MAHGYLEYFSKGKGVIYSAGIEKHGVNPIAILVMKEDGVDISHHTSNNVDEYRHIDFDHIITVCDHANEVCPVFPSTAKKFHHNFPDPAKAKGSEKEILTEFRRVRDMIKEFSDRFVKENIS
jgi:arsenate reductase